MENKKINKVYINPNFKKNLNSAPSTCGQINTMYVPYYYMQHNQNPHNYVNPTTSNRKIYLNPNFKLTQAQDLSLPTIRIEEKTENVQDYRSFISKSKYSLVANKSSKQEIGNKKKYVETISHTNIESVLPKTDPVYNQNLTSQCVLNNNKTKAFPIVKSRYSIVRKKSFTEIKLETVPKIASSNLNRSIENVSVNLNLANSYSNDQFKTVQKGGVLNEKLVEKVTKIKLSKYKTVPITYLKKTHPIISKNTEHGINRGPEIKITKSNKYKFSVLDTATKSRFMLIRSRNKSTSEASTPSRMYVQNNKKRVNLNHSKIKLNKTDFKLNNMPCRLFMKYGKCLRKDYGRCEYLHDKKHVSLCRKFLKGICHDDHCTLSHELSANKMPTCYFYLKGMCTKENCPYLHVKLSDKIKICQDFLRGYCESGDRCTFRHVIGNASKKVKSSKLMNTSRCSQSKSMNIKVKKGYTCDNKKKNLTPLKIKNNVKTQIEDENVDCRYYKDMADNEDVCENIKPTRCKLGTLPSFIQL